MSLLIGASSPAQGASGAQGAAADLGETIDQSLRYSSSTASLDRTPSASGDRRTWTFATWVKRSKLDSTQGLFGCSSGASDAQTTQIMFISADRLTLQGHSTVFRQTDMRFRDLNAWYHIVVVCDITNATANDRIRFYVNGSKITDWDSISNPGTGDVFGINQSDTHRIGRRPGNSDSLDGYLAETFFLDGIAIGDTNGVVDEFGRYNDDGVWVPQDYTGDFNDTGDVNGFHLTFDSSQSPNGIGTDSSGENNHWTSASFDEADVALYSAFEAGSGTSYESTASNRTSTLINRGSAFDGDTIGGTQVDEAGGGFWYLTYTINSVSGLRILMTGQTSEIAETRVNGSVATTSVSGSYIVISSPPSTVTEVAIRRNTANTQVYQVEVDTGSGFVALLDNNDNDVDFFDTPTSNYSTYNSLVNNDEPTFNQANLDADNFNNGIAWATQELPDEHLYCEFIRTAGDRFAAGVWDAEDKFEKGAANDNDYAFGIVYSEFGGNNNIYNENTTASQTGLTAYSTGDVLGVEWRGDLATRQVNFYINGTQVGTSENVAAGGRYYFGVDRAGGSTGPDVQVNFGQMPFIAAPSGVTNTANGMQTNNFAEPTIKNGKEHFEAKLYSGTNSSNAITGLEFSPDLIWIKVRDAADNHVLVDTIRGTDSVLFSNSDDAEASSFSRFTSFDSNGFTVDTSDTSWNNSSNNYVAWCWKAGTDYTPTLTGFTAATASINTEAGFGIYALTGSNTASSFTHGLDKTPELIICKNRDDLEDWAVFYPRPDGPPTPTDTYLRLNEQTDENKSGTQILTGNTSTTVSVASFNETASNDDYIYYLWHSVEGFSKMGRYQGNGSSDGVFVYCGFRPAFVMVKGTGTTNGWGLYDNARFENNPVNGLLYANSTNKESAFVNRPMDFLSNGFKCRDGNTNLNASASYMFMAFAEHPFGGENTPPVTAR